MIVIIIIIIQFTFKNISGESEEIGNKQLLIKIICICIMRNDIISCLENNL